MNLNIQPAKYSEKHLLRKMLELCVYDLSEFDDRDLNKFGEYGYRYLDCYWIESKRYPFIIRVNNNLAGFVLINQSVHNLEAEWAIAEFFVLKKYRQQKIGKQTAFFMFDRFPGVWEIGILLNNLVAKAFWQKIIQQYDSQNTRKQIENIEQCKVFWTFSSKE